MVLRDHQGTVIVAACREATPCRDATEAELMAIEEGMQVALLWTTRPFTVETDCTEAMELIKESTPNTSIYTFRISVIRELLKERNTRIDKVSREANMASHELAKIGRLKHMSAVWFVDLPPEVCRAIDQDCNPPIM
jgi:ribonuclease HI